VQALISPVPHTLDPQAALAQALPLMHEQPGDCLLVVQAQRPVGILTPRDVLRLYVQRLDPQGRCLADVMSAPVHSVATTTSVPAALQRMAELGIGRLAVVDEAGHLAGLLTRPVLERALLLARQVSALQADQARQRAVLDAIPDLVWLKDPDGAYVTCNPRFERLYGAREADIVGRTDYDFVPRELADFFRANDRRAMERDAPTVNEEELTFPDDGHRELTQTIKTPVRDADGRLLGVLGIGRDITALRRVEEGYRHLFARNPAPMLIYARDDLQLLTVNEAFEALYGYSAAQACALRLTDLCLPEDRPAIAQQAARTVGLAYAGEWRHMRRDGSVMHILAQSHDIHHEGRACRVAVITDVTPLHVNRERDHRRLTLLENLARGDSLDRLLRQLVLDYETAFPGSLCTVLLLCEDGLHVRLGAAPSLPDAYNRAIDGSPIGPTAGCCGAAMYHRRRVIVEDIATHPNWLPYLHAAQAAQLGSCWSEPIPGAGQQVLGSFAVYHHGPRSPSEQELEYLDFSVQLAALAISHANTAQQLRDSERRTREILHAIPDLIWVKDPQGVLRACNQRFAQFVGHAPEEAIGRLDQELLPPDVLDALIQADASVTATHASVTIERWLSFAGDDHRGLFEIIKTPLFDEAGQLQGVLGVARDITLIKQGARAIAEQERLVDTMFSQTTDSIVLVDPTTQGIVTFNDAACTGLGYTREQFARLKPQDFQTEYAGQRIGDNIQRALEGESLSFETQHRRADGGLQDAAVTLRTLSYAGRPLLSAVWRDVTEARAHEARIRRLNQAYAVLSGVNEAIVRVHDRQALFAEACRITVEEGGLRLAWIGQVDPASQAIVPAAQAGPSDGYVENLCLSLAAPLGPTALALLQGQPMLVNDMASDPRTAPWRERALARGLRASAAFPIRLNDRTEGCLNVYADQPGFFDTDLLRLFERLSSNLGFALAFLAAEQELQRHRQHLEELVATRTTQLEALNQRLHREDERLRAMLLLSRLAASLDEEALWQRGLSEAMRLTGSRSARLATPAAAGQGERTLAQVGEPPADPAVATVVVPIEDEGRVAGLLQAAGKAQAYDADDARELGLIGTELWGIVQRRRIELALEQAKLAADAASQAKTAFLANMSHEIRTPMNAIVGFAHLLRRDPLTPRQRDHLDKIADASEHLLQVINDILDFSKIEAHKVDLHLGAFHLAASLARIADMVHGRLRNKAVQFHVELAPGCPVHVVGDRLRLEQVLLNLASNAVKFTEQGSVEIRVTPLQRSDERAWLHFAVVDTGIGVSPAQSARLFEAFEQADASTTRRYGGTGLGLAISKRLVELMDGRIGMDSQPGQGSTFWFELPLGLADTPAHTPVAAPAEAAPDALDVPDGGARLRGARLLLAEDNPINQEVARDLLAALGAQVDVACDGAQALRMAAEQDYELILMDVQMPVMDGLEATAAIRRLPGRAAVPILALTASTFAEDRRLGLGAGMNDFLIKPVEPEALRHSLLHWLREGDRLRGRGAAPLPSMAAASPPQVRTSPGSAVATGAAALHLEPLAQHPGFDPKGALRRLRGDEKLYRRMLELFLEHHADDGPRLQAALQAVATATDRAAACDALRALAHGLVGTAATIGAQALSTACRALEIAAVEQRSQAALATAVAQVERELSGGLPTLQAALAHPGAPGESPAPPAPPTQPTQPTPPTSPQPMADATTVAAARAALERLRELLTLHDTEALDAFDQAHAPLAATLGAQARELGQRIHGFDFEAALVLVERLLDPPP
jgi:PAS domain S-box-containing protein